MSHLHVQSRSWAGGLLVRQWQLQSRVPPRVHQRGTSTTRINQLTILQWLLRHTECCLCKNVFLPVDEKRGKAKAAALQELSTKYAAAAATSYFCTSAGLVRIPKSVRCTKAQLEQLERRIFDGTVAPGELVRLRGSREPTTNHTGFQQTQDSNYIVGDDEIDDVTISRTSSGDETDRSNSTMSSGPHDVETGTEQILLSATDLLESAHVFDNRCCIEEEDDCVEVRSTTSKQLEQT